MTAGRSVDDERVQPRADGKPGTARGLPGGFTDLGTNSLYVPRHVSHAHSPFRLWTGRDFRPLGRGPDLRSLAEFAQIARGLRPGLSPDYGKERVNTGAIWERYFPFVRSPDAATEPGLRPARSSPQP